MNGLEQNQEPWPIIGQSDVEGVCRELCESILTLEHAFEGGDLASRLTLGHFEQVLGPKLCDAYSRLAENVAEPLHNLRVESVKALLAQLQNDLLPTQIGEAWVRKIESECEKVLPGTDRPARFCFQLVDARLNSSSSTTVRVEQILGASFSRFPTRELCDEFSRELVRRATRRLASDLIGLQKILERFRRRILPSELRIVPYPAERRFEHLMLDILNEEDRHARMAPLVEDFLEKTDFRVTYPGVKRRHGARVQVTSIIGPELHAAKVQGIKLAEEYVFLSPLSLANFVAVLQGRRTTLLSGTPTFELVALWNCMETKPLDVPQLASDLKRILLSALAEIPNSPLGPMARVPLPIRQLIRIFVETHAVVSTSRLRERERSQSRNIDSEVETSTDALFSRG